MNRALEREARLTEIAYERLSLEALVKQADVIVLARPASPPRRTRKISIVPAGAKPDAEKYPPYERVLGRWQIVEVLRGDQLAPRATVEIDEAYFAMRLDLHRQSPPVDAAAPERILFLERGGDGALSFAVANAEESPAQKQKIVALLAAAKR